MFLSMFMFAGCNLIEINKAKYYNQIVISVELKDGYGEDYNDYIEKYTKKDLINAYYNYAYNYVSNGQIKASEGMNYAINNMVNVDLLYKYIKKNYFDNPNYDIQFTDADRNEVKLKVYDAIQEQITSLEKEVYEEWNYNYTNQDDLSEDKVESLRKAYEAYDSKVLMTNIKVDVVVEGSTTEVEKQAIILNPNQLTKTYDTRVAGDTFKQQISDPEVSKEAYTRYIKQLQEAAKAEGAKTGEQEVLNAEIERLTKSYTRSEYISIFEKWYNINYNFTYNAKNNVYVLNDSVKQTVVDYFKERYTAQKNQYENDESAYHTAMAGDSIDDIYYHYNSGNEYMYVSHILMKFSDAQKAEITELKNKLSAHKITQENYDARVKEIANRTVVTYEIDGKKYTSNALEVTNKIKNYVNKAQYKGKTGEELELALNERAKLFNDMIYLYNDDEGIMNKDFAYVVNLDTEVKDKMVKEFADTARKLNKEQEEGALSDMVITEYGVHILYHAGIVKNVVSDINSLTAEDLMSVKTQRSSNKTIFAKIYDTVATENYKTAASNFVSNCFEFVNIVKYENRYKDLTK